MLGMDDSNPSIEGKPKKSKLRSEECYAREVLKALDGERFGELQFSERPDLVDRRRSIGVEVTQATFEGDRHAEAIFSKVVNQQGGFIGPKQQQKLESLGCEYFDGFLLEPARWASEARIVHVCKVKLKLLNNKNYEDLSHYYLFIVTDESLTSYVADSALSSLLNLYNRFNMTYISIFVSDRFFPETLLELDMTQNVWLMHRFDSHAADTFWSTSWDIIRGDYQ